MKNVLTTIEYKIFKKYEKYFEDVKDYVWDYKKPNDDITQLEHNKTLGSFIRYYMKEFDLDVVITSPLICTIFDDFDNFLIIGKNDVYNYERYKSDISNGFEPFYLIREDGNNVGVVIRADFRVEPNNIILTNNDASDIKIIDIWNIPRFKLIDCFKN